MKSFKIRHRIISFFQDIDVKGFRKIAFHLPKIIIPKPTKIVTIKTLYGFVLQINPVKDNGLEKSIYYTGTYEKGTLFVLKEMLNNRSIFVDIGANIGLMTIFASQIIKENGKVIAFEPNPKTVKILKNNIQINNCKNCSVAEFALGNKTETTKIYDRWDENRGSASLIKPKTETESYTIKLIRLEDYFSKNNDVIDVIKMDIEGYELEALKGAKTILEKQNAPMLIVECSETRDNFNGATQKELFHFIKMVNNYKVFKLKGSKSRKSKLIEIRSENEMPLHDNVFCFLPSHLKGISSSIFS